MTAAGWFWIFYLCLAVTVLLWVTGCGETDSPPPAPYRVKCPDGWRLVWFEVERDSHARYVCRQVSQP